MGLTLEEALARAYEAPREPEQRERFRIENSDQANWALRKLAIIRREMKQAEEQADREIQRIEYWLKGELERLQGDAEFFESLLCEYHRGIYEQNPKAKTVKLPAGALKLRAQQPEFKRDEDKLIVWLKGTGRADLVKIKESADWSALKKDVDVVNGQAIIKDTGEVVEGVTAIERPPKFSVEVDIDD